MPATNRAVLANPRQGMRAVHRVRALGTMRPGFLVIGGKRCGSTSLYEYMTRHPAVLPCRVRKGTHYFDVNAERGWPWYCSKFPSRVGVRARVRGTGAAAAVTGEASPYYMFHPLAPERIAAALPEVRLLAILRDPVDRAWSHYQYSVRRGFEDLSFEDALDAEESRLAGEVERMTLDPSYRSHAHRHQAYLARGRYAEHLEPFFDRFPSEQILILQSEMLFTDPDETLARAFRFLGLPPVALGEQPAFKAGDYGKPVPRVTAERLTEYYAQPNARLYAIPGVEFTWADRGRGNG